MKKNTVILMLLSTLGYCQIDSSYSKFLILKSQAIDYYPVWGKTDNEIYVNLMSKEWRRYDLTKCKYSEGTYYNYKLAINTSDNWVKVTDSEKIQKLESDEKWKPREIKDKKGRIFSIEEQGGGAAFFITDTNGIKTKMMNISGNAHSLAISPSGKYIACLFELSGLIIIDIEKEMSALK